MVEFPSFGFPDGEGRTGRARRSHMGKDREATMNAVSGELGTFHLIVSVWGTKGSDNSMQGICVKGTYPNFA